MKNLVSSPAPKGSPCQGSPCHGSPCHGGIYPDLSPTALRDIVEIDPLLCDGCGQCLPGCAEGALTIKNGRVHLASEALCDGLGACLAHCPKGALKIVRRLSKAFDVSLVNSEVTLQDTSKASPQASIPASSPMKTREYNQTLPNLSSWPIKLELVSPAAPFFDRAILVLAADCAMAAALDFRERFLGLDKSLIIGCPKLGDWSLYEIKLTTILQKHPKIAELWLPIMSVHCCQGFWHLAKKVLAQSNRLDVALKGWIFSPDGELEAESLTLEAGVGY